MYALQGGLLSDLYRTKNEKGEWTHCQTHAQKKKLTSAFLVLPLRIHLLEDNDLVVLEVLKIVPFVLFAVT